MSKVQRMLWPAVVMLLIAGCSERTAPTAAPFTVGGPTAERAADARPLVRDFGVEVPDAYFALSRTFTIRTGGFTPPDTLGRYLLCTAPPGSGTDQLMPLNVTKDGYIPGGRDILGGWDERDVIVQLVRHT